MTQRIKELKTKLADQDLTIQAAKARKATKLALAPLKKERQRIAWDLSLAEENVEGGAGFKSFSDKSKSLVRDAGSVYPWCGCIAVVNIRRVDNEAAYTFVCICADTNVAYAFVRVCVCACVRACVCSSQAYAAKRHGACTAYLPGLETAVRVTDHWLFKKFGYDTCFLIRV